MSRITNTFAGRPIPLGSFGSVMGITGLGLAWRSATEALHAPAEIGEWLIAAGAIVFVLLLVAWIARTVVKPAELQREEHVATTESYFASITISCSLLAAGAVPYSRVVAMILWIVAAFGGAGLIVYLQGSWIARGIKDSDLTPSLFLPIVGNATAVYAAVPLGYAQLGWASFAFAIVGWVVYAPLILYRLLVTEPRLPRKLAPQLALLISPPAVMASAWCVLTGAADPVFKILAFKALFFAFLALRLWKMAWGEPFSAATWGYTFPTAALAGAFVRAEPTPFYDDLAVTTLSVATIIVAACAAWTFCGWIRRALETRTLEAAP